MVNAAAVQVMSELRRVQDELAMLKGDDGKKDEVKVRVKESEKGVKKNQKPGKPDPNKFYTRVRKMATFGRVPQQQEDIRKILEEGMVLGREYAEPEVFAMLVDGCGDYVSLTSSRQDVTYLFRYYRGLKPEGNHAGYIARGFLRMR